MSKTENLEKTEKFKALKLTMDKIDKDPVLCDEAPKLKIEFK